MPGKRRAPIRHTVHTRDPRYNVDNYNRGHGDRIASVSSMSFDSEFGSKPDSILSPMGFFSVYPNGQVIPQDPNFDVHNQDPNLLTDFLVDTAIAYNLEIKDVTIHDRSRGASFRIPDAVRINSVKKLKQRRAKIESVLAPGYKWVGKGKNRVLITPDGKAIYRFSYEKPNTEKYSMIFSKPIPGADSLMSAIKDREYYNQWYHSYNENKVGKSRFNPHTGEWEVWMKVR